MQGDTNSRSSSLNYLDTRTVPDDSVATQESSRLEESALSKSQAAYLSDLPDLLIGHRGEWVAYGDGVRLKLAKTQRELYRYCLEELKLTHDRFVVRRITPPTSDPIEYNLR
jgi:hypothetical protein